MNFRNEERKKRTLNLDITPLVDTVFNLMIFFALSMNFISFPGMKVNLPKASSATTIKERKNLEIVITANGRVYFEKKEIKNVREEMVKLFKEGKYKAVVVKADRGTPHGRVVEVLDAAKSAGFRKFAIATEFTKK